MRCPKCGERPQDQAPARTSALEECPACKGIWLDNGELEKLAARESSGWLARFLGLGD